MLFVIHGTDNVKVADKTAKLVASLLSKKPDAQVFYFDDGELEEAELDALTGAQGLFVEKHIVVLKQPFINEQAKEVVLKRLPLFKASQNIIVLAEGKLLAADKKKLEKHAEKIEEHEAVKEKAVAPFNVFALGDALGVRDKRGLWTLYVQALRAGLEVQSVHGTLHWAVRSLLAAQHAAVPEEAGQKPFMYSKYKRYLANYSTHEVQELSHDLIRLYHDARRGKGDLKVTLERWILTL